MSTIPFESIDNPAPKKKTPPIVCIGPRGEIAAMPGSPKEGQHMGGDVIGRWVDGTFTIAKRHRECSFETDENGNAYPVGWSTYEDLCTDARVLERHGLKVADSVDYYKKHMRLLALRDAGNDVHKAVKGGVGWDNFYHPEIVRRRAIPKEFGQVLTPDQLADFLGGGDATPAPKDELAELTKPRGKKRAG